MRLPVRTPATRKEPPTTPRPSSPSSSSAHKNQNLLIILGGGGGGGRSDTPRGPDRARPAPGGRESNLSLAQLQSNSGARGVNISIKERVVVAREVMVRVEVGWKIENNREEAAKNHREVE